MLRSELTWFDILWVFQTFFTVIAIFIAYKEGEKRGSENSRRRKSVKRYKLPSNTMSPEEFLDRLNVLQGGDRIAREISHQMKRTKPRSRRR